MNSRLGLSIALERFRVKHLNSRLGLDISPFSLPLTLRPQQRVKSRYPIKTLLGSRPQQQYLCDPKCWPLKNVATFCPTIAPYLLLEFGCLESFRWFLVSSESDSYPYGSVRKQEDMKEPCFHQKIVGDVLSLHRKFKETFFKTIAISWY